ncbi:MAG TPA: TIGR00282 family metallophosphoesterase [Spirochaetia bacterium]|nr:TIGR00282 family metallophosphoesterase [Spirochaetia bacterium]
MAKVFRALILGDVVGQSGCRAILLGLPGLIKKLSADVVVVNGENAVEGFGITPDVAAQIFKAGAHVITTGNHVWQKNEILAYLDTQEHILRPANYPAGVAGHGSCVVEVHGVKVGVMNLQGRVRMWSIDCPFRKAKEIVRKLRQDTKIMIVDFHAEATEEKEALGLYLDGDVTVVVGTHTHTQTADERILPNGTAYITDLGMSGPKSSVIGFDPVIGVQRALSQMPLKNEVSDNPALLQGIFVEIDPDSGKAVSVTRIREESLV